MIFGQTIQPARSHIEYTLVAHSCAKETSQLGTEELWCSRNAEICAPKRPPQLSLLRAGPRSATPARHDAWSCQSSPWLQWLVLDRCCGLALVHCIHSMDLQPAACYLDSLQYSHHSPTLAVGCLKLSSLVAPRLHGQMAGPNSRAASAQCSRSIESVSLVRADVPVGSIVHAHWPQSDRTAHSACAALIALSPTDGWTASSTLKMRSHHDTVSYLKGAGAT